MTTAAKFNYWFGSALLGCVAAGMFFDSDPAHWIGAVIGIIVLEPVRRWAARQVSAP